LEWLGHVVRMDGERTTKSCWNANQEEVGGGRPRLRWMDDVKLDLRNMGVKRRRRNSFGQNKLGICHQGSQGQT
jgi:hypothetical protein